MVTMPKLRPSHASWLAGGDGHAIYWDAMSGHLQSGYTHHSGSLPMVLSNQDLKDSNYDAATLMSMYRERMGQLLEADMATE